MFETSCLDRDASHGQPGTSSKLVRRDSACGAGRS